MANPDSLALTLLNSAEQSPRGIRVTTSDPETLRRKLYIARKALGLKLIIQPGPTPNELWLRKPEAKPPSF